MPTRVVRFTDVTQERVDGLKARLAESDGPPEGVVSSGITFLYDAGQQTAIVLQHFDSQDDMTTSEAVLEAMDSGETPGTRASVDRCETIAELHA